MIRPHIYIDGLHYYWETEAWLNENIKDSWKILSLCKKNLINSCFGPKFFEPYTLIESGTPKDKKTTRPNLVTLII